MSLAAQQLISRRYQQINSASNGSYQRRSSFNAGGTKSYSKKSSALFSFVKTLENDENKLNEIKARIGHDKNRVSIFDLDGFIVAKTPYNLDFVQACKSLGGLFIKQLYCWFFAPEKKERVCQAASQCFGQQQAVPQQEQTTQVQVQAQAQNQATVATQTTMQNTKQVQVAHPPILTVEQLISAQKHFNHSLPFYFTQIGNTIFCRIPLQSPFTQVARQCCGVWFKDLQAWALDESLRANFAPIYNQLKNQSCNTVQTNQAN